MVEIAAPARAQIDVTNLRKYYQVHQKEPGFAGSIRSFVHRKYVDVKAIDDLSFQIDKGEIVGFLGPNGAGKTTTLKVLSGLLYPTGGSARVMGYTPYERRAEYLRLITLVMGQKQQLNWDLPAIESFLVNQAIYEIPDDQFKRTADELTPCGVCGHLCTGNRRCGAGLQAGALLLLCR